MDSIALAITTLSNEQRSNGGFLSYSSSDPENFTEAKRYPSPFPAATIVNALDAAINDPSLSAIQQKAVDYLLTQQGSHWSYNYWERNSKPARQHSYPDDLDDTFAALSAIYANRPTKITGEALAKIVALLTSLETTPGGPYRTWLIKSVADPIWLDIDIAVNAQIAFFLKRLGITMPKLDLYLHDQLHSDRLDSPYYPSRMPAYYYLARVVSEPADQSLLSTKIEQLLKHAAPNSLNLSLALASYRRLGQQPSTLAVLEQQLHSSIAQDSYKAYPFCYDPAINTKPYYAGSPALTAAFCLEALAPAAKQTKTSPIAARHKAIEHQIAKDFVHRLAPLPKPFRDHLNAAKDRVMQHNESHAICLLPTLFDDAITPTIKKKRLSQRQLSQLGLGHLYGWIGYTLADDLLDNEGTIDTLPLMTFCLREMISIFIEAGQRTPAFQSLFTTVMDRLEAANYWEVTHCRIDPEKIDSKRLRSLSAEAAYYADRSIGHALGPLAVLAHYDFSENDTAVHDWLVFFSHYLTARQLNDDAHDWFTDLKAGQLNPVNAQLIETYVTNNPKHLSLSATVLAPELEKIFWKTTLTTVAQEILENVALATAALERMAIFIDTDFLHQLLHKPEQSAKQVLQEHKKTTEFIATYYQQ